MEAPFPSTLHEPAQMLWFNSVEWYLILLIFIGGLLSHASLWICGIPFYYQYLPFARKQLRGYFTHLLYTAGLFEIKGYPPVLAMEFSE